MFAGLPLGLPCQFHVLLLPLVHIAQYSGWVSPYSILGFPSSFYSLGTLGPFHSLGHPWPILFLGHPQPVSFHRASSTHFIFSYFLHSHGLLLNLLGFPGPITTSFAFGQFTNSFLWAPLVPFLLSFYFLW